MDNEELTGKIIGAAYRVFNTMGYGFVESVYENCLLIELRKLGLQAENQFAIKVYYEGHVVGDFFADIFVARTVIVELKSVRGLAPAHEVQLVNYLKATGIDIGLLINFGEQRVEVKRKKRVLSDQENSESDS